MEASSVMVPQEAEMRREALTVVERAQSLTITSQESYSEACAILTQEIMPARKRWKDFWYGSDSHPGPVKLARSTWQSLIDKFNVADAKLELAEKSIKVQVAKWEQEQQRLREAAQRAAQVEAERLAAEDAEREALFAELSGASPEQVEAIVPVPVVAAPVEPMFERASGVSTRSKWTASVQDMKKLCAAIGKGQVPVSYVLPNQTALNARASADKSTMQIPGVVAVEEKIVAGRAR